MVPSGRLPARDPLVRRLDAVADGIANQMEHRIHHPLDEELVDFRRLAGQLQLHALAAVPGEIADDERHAPENLGDRDQPHAHHAFAQVAQLPLDALGVLLQRRATRRRA